MPGRDWIPAQRCVAAPLLSRLGQARIRACFGLTWKRKRLKMRSAGGDSRKSRTSELRREPDRYSRCWGRETMQQQRIVFLVLCSLVFSGAMARGQIGRASCRERGEISVVAVS